MRRFPFVIGSTVAGLAGILAFHTRGTTGILSNSLQVKANSPSHSPGQAHSSQQSGSSNSPNSTSTSTSVSSPQSPSIATGSSEQYGYGVLSVKVTIRGARITDLQVVNLQTDTQYSQQIAVQVIPYLKNEVLSAQSARINGISGATYTSEAYALSVQSALDSLHFK